ncbi:hypothetical protein [Gymnodinialimonas hymeniacidonis]|uniref:hypothetical protein n=1 Tax=Gymnodinialimonas hymeniacidonis TaxID=3126508 RepID=UPI0034C61EA5
MSDPAKTPEEIEDVLASIRRLVSDHTPGPDGSMQPAEEDEVAPAAAAPVSDDRLVLTPSFRVTEPDDPWLTVAEAEAEPEDEAATESSILDVLAQDDAAAPEQATDADDSEWQPDDRLAQYDSVGPDEDGGSPDLHFEADAVEGSVEVDAMLDEDGTSDADDVADLIRLDGSTPEIADFESETGDDNWPSDGAEAALLTLVARRDNAAPEAEADVPHDGVSKVEEEVEASLEEGETAEMVEPNSETTEQPVRSDAEVAEPEVVDVVEADEAETLADEAAPVDEEAASTPIFSRQRPFDEVVEPELEPEPEPVEAVEAEDLGEEPSPFTFPDADEGILDEETLREIIVEVVREELQGVLGQRITRNVRKMVRREIRLALAAEDLD